MTPGASAILARLVEDALARGVDLDRRQVVYLLHFARPNAHARHYLGMTTRRLGVRLVEHIGGRANGSTLIAAVVAAGIPIRVARLWPGGDGLEARLKRRKKGPSLCPICRAGQPAIGVVAPGLAGVRSAATPGPIRAAP
jgi:hypothetical protein